MIELTVAPRFATAYVWLMQETEALTIMSALAQTTRLKVLVLLAKAGEEGMASSDIADAVDVPRHLMSAHLAVLSKALAVTAKKTGRTVTYCVCSDVILDLSAYLSSLVAADREQETAV